MVHQTPKIQVLSKANAAVFDPGIDWSCISVTTKPDDWPEFINPPKQLLQLRFADLDLTQQELKDYGERAKDEYGTPFFHFLMAEAILDFFINIETDLLLVHCEAGWSRSPGIAAALSKTFFREDFAYFQQYTPNMFVYRTILNTAFDRGLFN